MEKLIELLKRAVIIVEESEDAPAHAQWIAEAKCALWDEYASRNTVRIPEVPETEKRFNFYEGDRIIYDDGREGHRGIFGTVLDSGTEGMKVQFDDRAQSTYIAFSDLAWGMNYISKVKPEDWAGQRKD